MKYFIKSLFSFILITFIVITLIQVIISIRISGKTVRGHDNLEQTSNINADLVFIGSSRCWAHFDPQFFNQTYNLKSLNIGVDGHPEVAMAITRLKDYLSRNTPPKFIIFSFDPQTYPGSFEDNTNFTHKDDFARYAFLPKKKDTLIVNYFKYNIYEKYIPMYSIFKYKLLSNALFLNNRCNYINYGYEMHNEKWDTVANPITAKLKENFFKKRDIIPITNALKNLNELCHINNIKLLCIQTPVYKIIYDDSIFLETKQICANLNIPFIDLNKEKIRNNIDFFYNSNHINKSGIAEMNQELMKDTIMINFLRK